MGSFATEKRKKIKDTFEATSADLKNGAEPIAITWRKTKKNALTGELRTSGNTMRLDYRIVDPALEDDDVSRVFHIAYLDVFTSHHWRESVGGKFGALKLQLNNVATNLSMTMPYPDPE